MKKLVLEKDGMYYVFEVISYMHASDFFVKDFIRYLMMNMVTMSSEVVFQFDVTKLNEIVDFDKAIETSTEPVNSSYPNKGTCTIVASIIENDVFFQFNIERW